MRRQLAGLLRRAAHRLDPQPYLERSKSGVLTIKAHGLDLAQITMGNIQDQRSPMQVDSSIFDSDRPYMPRKVSSD